jgi:hypothetical protein
MSATVTTSATLSVTIIVLITPGMAMVIVVTDSLAMLAIATETPAMFFLRHLQGINNGSAPSEEEEKEAKGGRLEAQAWPS